MAFIGVTGMPASGKSLFAEVAGREGYKVYDLSLVLKRILNAQGKEINSKNLSALASKLRREEGMDYVARKLYKLLPKKGKVLISGFRSYPEIEYLKGEFPGMVMVSVIADKEKRLKLTLETRKYGINSRKAFDERDRRDAKLGIGRCICLSDYFLFNDVGKDAFIKKCKKLLRTIEGKHGN
jgi:dephospho-CoA kinase